MLQVSRLSLLQLLPEVKSSSADSKKDEGSTADGDRGDRGTERESGVSVGNQEDTVDRTAVEGSHVDAEKDEEDSSANSWDNCGPSDEAMETSDSSESSWQPSTSLMPPPRSLPTHMSKIGKVFTSPNSSPECGGG